MLEYQIGAYEAVYNEVSTTWGNVVHLEISRSDGSEIHNWEDLQAVKQEIVGDRLAIEIYPEKAETVNNANAYHLWVMPEGFHLPFGLTKNYSF